MYISISALADYYKLEKIDELKFFISKIFDVRCDLKNFSDELRNNILNHQYGE